MDSLQRIRQANQEKAKQEAEQARNAELTNSNAAMQRAIFEAFRSMTDAISGDKTKAEAIAQIFKVLEQLGSEFKASKTEVETLRAGLTTLEKELKDIPTGDLKNIPKFLQRQDKISVTNLTELKEYFTTLEKAIKGIKTTVEAPVVNVPQAKVVTPAPIVNVDAPDLTPVNKGLEEVSKAVKSVKLPDVVKTEQMNTLIPEKFDEYKITYAGLEEEDDEIEAITYLYKGKKVAKIQYKYSDGKLIGGKRV